MFAIYEFWYSPSMQAFNGKVNINNWSTTSLGSLNEFSFQQEAYRHASEIAMDCALFRDASLRGLTDPFHQVVRGYFFAHNQQCPAFHVGAQQPNVDIPQWVVTFYVQKE